MDNLSGIDAGTTEAPTSASMFAPCLTCENSGERQGAQLFPHPMHKIRHGLWTNIRSASPGPRNPLR
ncbi:hypothetical protein GCM10023083_53400 [Streptomyces phyllanthi]